MGWARASVPAVSPLPSHCPTAPSSQVPSVTGMCYWLLVPSAGTDLGWVFPLLRSLPREDVCEHRGHLHLRIPPESGHHVPLQHRHWHGVGAGQRAVPAGLAGHAEPHRWGRWRKYVVTDLSKAPNTDGVLWMPPRTDGRGRQLSLSQCEQKAHRGTRLWIWCCCYTVHGLKAWVIPYLLIPSWSLGGEKEGPEQTSSVWDPGWHVVPTVLARH